MTLAAMIVLAASTGAAPLRVETFDLTAPAEVHAVVTARCAQCDWGRRGREAAVLTVTVDGRESQDLVLARGAESAGVRDRSRPRGARTPPRVAQPRP